MDSDEHSIVVDGSSPGPLLLEVRPAKKCQTKRILFKQILGRTLPKSTEFFKLKLKVVMNLEFVCMCA